METRVWSGRACMRLRELQHGQAPVVAKPLAASAFIGGFRSFLGLSFPVRIRSFVEFIGNSKESAHRAKAHEGYGFWCSLWTCGSFDALSWMWVVRRLISTTLQEASLRGCLFSPSARVGTRETNHNKPKLDWDWIKTRRPWLTTHVWTIQKAKGGRNIISFPK